MLCEQCQQNPASLHFTQVINGEKNQMHLCEQCAKSQGVFTMQDVTSLLSGLLEGSASRAQSAGSLRCSRCGMAYAQFKESGVLGCANCYQDFRKQLSPVLQRIHGRLQHEGHIPASASESLQLKRQIEAKRREMQGAIEQEEFERAAGLRDELRLLQNKLEAQQEKAQKKEGN